MPTNRPLLSTTALPAELTVLMKLRLMKTPTRIQHTAKRMIAPNTPICARNRLPTAMPNSPPHPVEQQKLHLSAKTNPRVSDPRIMMRKSARMEWLSNKGRLRMIRTPMSTSITGTRIPHTPNDASTSSHPNRAPLHPHGLLTVSPSNSRSSTLLARTLWSDFQVKNEKNTAATAKSPAKSNTRPTIQRALSRLLRWAFVRAPGEVEELFRDAIA